MTAGVEPAFITYSDGVLVVVQAVSTDHPFRATSLYATIATDNVVIAYAELESAVAVPGVDLSDRTQLVGLHCRTMNHYQCYRPHDCTTNVPNTVVIMAAPICRSLTMVDALILIFIIYLRILMVKITD